MRPTGEQLEGIDLLIYDMQDVGARYYTYISTMLYGMEAASDCGIAFIVADRPNPIACNAVEGPVLESGSESFVGIHTDSDALRVDNRRIGDAVEGGTRAVMSTKGGMDAGIQTRDVVR